MYLIWAFIHGLLLQTIEKCFSKDLDILITKQGKKEDYSHRRDDHGASTSAATPSPFNVAGMRGIDSPLADSPGGTEINKPVSALQREDT